MLWILAVLVGMGVGLANSTQSLVSATVARSLGIWGATLLSFVVGPLFLIPLAYFTNQFSIKRILELPVWLMFASGMLGALMVFGRTYLVPRVGIGATMAFVVVGQLVSGAIFDHIGFMGYRQILLGPARLLGVGLIVIGMLIVLQSANGN
jgi:transporter family-2 protein